MTDIAYALVSDGKEPPTAISDGAGSFLYVGISTEPSPPPPPPPPSMEIKYEAITGSAGTTFSLAATPNPSELTIMAWRGLTRFQGVDGDYTISGSEITTAEVVDPASDNPQIWYWITI